MQPIYARLNGKVVVGSHGNLLGSVRLAFECEVVRVADDIGHNRVGVRTVFSVTFLNDGDGWPPLDSAFSRIGHGKTCGTAVAGSQRALSVSLPVGHTTEAEPAVLGVVVVGNGSIDLDIGSTV